MTALFDVTNRDKIRFEKFFDQSCAGCWEWQGSTHASGYGQISICGKPRRAHRVSYLIYRGPIEPGLFVLHRCDNRKCVRPDHLFLGTSQDNVTDMEVKGRARKVCPRGEKNGN